VGQWAQELTAALKRFSGHPAYKQFRAADRRSFILGYREIDNLTRDDASSPHQLFRASEAMLRFIEGLSTINRRELIVLHDQQTLSFVEAHLSLAATEVLQSDVEQGRSQLKLALQRAERLLGRDPAFDSFLGMIHGVEPSNLDEQETLAAIEHTQRMVAFIPRT
jgi:hypothetical protein